MNIIRLVPFLFLSIMPFHGFVEDAKSSESVLLSGKVVDSSNREALTGVIVKVLGQEQSVFTDFEGEFKISLSREEKYTLQLEYISYAKKVIIGIHPEELPVLIMMEKEGGVRIQKDERINPRT